MAPNSETNESVAVLLVDDTPANLLALEAVLTPLGVDMDQARSGKEALSFVEQRPFAVALIDVQMPEMDGFELARRIRETRYGKGLPIVFVTAVHDDEQFVRRGYATGAADYLTKPFDANVIRARVKAFVELYEQREAVRRGQVALRTQERDEAIRRLVAFERIASAALETHDLKALLEELLQAFIGAADAADSVSILLREGETLRVAASLGLKDGLEAAGTLRVGQGFAGLVASERKPIEISEEAVQELVKSDHLKARSPRALYGVPLLHDGEVLGVAHMGSSTADRFSPEEKRLFWAAAERAAMAMGKQLELSQLHEILSAAPAYIAIVSVATGRYSFVNPPLRQLLGETGTNGASLEQDFGTQVRQVLRDVLASADTVKLEELAVKSGDEERFFRLSAQPLRNATGKIDRVLLFATDVTAQVAARKELEAAQTARARLLARERAARRAAELANTAKDEFLATVSHELRTPLTAILGWASLARSRPLADVPRALNVIERNARAQARIVEDVLDFSRMSMGRMRLTPQRVELEEVVRLALESVRPAAEAKNIRLIVGVDVKQALTGDAGRLQQVVWNLLSNAVKYTDNGGQVEIHAVAVDDTVTLTVRDDGHGIPPEFLPHVFEPFRQANGSTTRRHGGLGLGLSIVRHIVQAHGGTIEAFSEGSGKGSTFTVTLPKESRYVPPEAEPHSDEAPRTTDETARLDGLRVLVVDDDEDGREVMAQGLMAYGAEVLTLSSPLEVVGEIERFRPDVLVSDIAMPNMDGYELIAKVRALAAEQGGAVPAMAVTAHAGKEVLERVIRAGFDCYASKPIDLVRFVGSVADLATIAASQRSRALAQRLNELRSDGSSA